MRQLREVYWTGRLWLAFKVDVSQQLKAQRASTAKRGAKKATKAKGPAVRSKDKKKSVWR